MRTKKFFWILGPKSKHNLRNKLMIYRTIIKSIWVKEIQLWVSERSSNIEILHRFQSKKNLRLISNFTNKDLHVDLNMAMIHDEILQYSAKYTTRLGNHIKRVAGGLLADEKGNRGLKKKQQNHCN